MTASKTIAPHLYARVGKRRTQFFTVLAGKHHDLGYDEQQARARLAVLWGLPPAVRTISEMCEGFIAEQKQYRRDGDPNALSERTIADYEADLRRICIIFGGMAPAAFKSSHGAQYLDKMRKSQKAVSGNRRMAALASAFNYGLRVGVVEANPCRGVRRNPERPRTRKVEIAELNAFLAHAKARGGSAYMVALIGCCVAITGRRRAEILSLPKAAVTQGGISVKDCKIKPGETDRSYLVEWSPMMRLLFDEAAAIPRRVSSLFLFPNLDGQPYTDDGFGALWQDLMHSYAPGGPKSPEWFRAHDLRALYVSEMLAQKRDPATHRNEATMRRVYDRNRTIKVTPLA